MKCPVCKVETEEGAVFCNHCGTDLRLYQGNADSNIPVVEGEQEMNAGYGYGEDDGNSETYFDSEDDFYHDKPDNETQEGRKKKIMIGVGIGIAALVLVIALIVVLVVISNQKHEIDLRNYVSVSFSGYDGHGEASVTFDDEKFNEDIEKYGKQPRKKTEYFMELMDEYIELGAVMKQDADIQYSLDSYSELSNGDVVTLTFTFDREVANQYKIELIGESTEFEVEGLSEVEQLDVFKDVKVVFDGISPYITAQVVNNSEDERIKEISFSLDKESDIKKGETVTVSIDSSESEWIEEYGCSFKEYEKKYECNAANEYIKKIDDIPKDTMSGMKSQTQDVIDSYFASNQETYGHGEYHYEGCYMLTSKVENEYTNNIVYIVYSTKVTSKDDSFKSKTIYMPVRYENIVKYADGTGYVDLNSTEINGRTELEPSWNTINGYGSKTKMYNELVASQKAQFNCESSEEME